MTDYTAHITELGVELHHKGRLIYVYKGTPTGNHELNERGRIIGLLAERIVKLEAELEDHAGLLTAAVEAVNEAAPADWQGPPMPGDAPPPFIRWQAKRIAELEADNASEGRWAEQYFRERQEAYRLLCAALRENPQWHTDASTEAERLLDELDDPAVIDVPGKGKVLVQTDDDEAERVRRELDRRVKEAEEEE